ncbi:MAG: hypothetical protein A2698_01755 [Candidatus Levybacteria bacterium RIFCSPHIGHO2_01_FULL_42_15]|nr:MAG: hypothetical protein A2698_01755 [Candidatus Levybacteria bacterium RIFCSPHIGHO2_01_FULL_42_15]OGH42657.1 MAG: hypothetical protein A3B53_02620 [Candidatus Levybacteria bacterium RIFCSPLOWO2_01_FULL_42_15]
MIAGRIQVEKPITATIDVRCTLGNDTAPYRLKLLELDVEEKAGLATKLALRVVNIRGKVEAALQDPNRALYDALGRRSSPGTENLLTKPYYKLYNFLRGPRTTDKQTD